MLLLCVWKFRGTLARNLVEVHMQQRSRRKPNKSRQNNQGVPAVSGAFANSYHPVISQTGSVSGQENSQQKIILLYHEHLKRFWSFDSSNISKEHFCALLKLVDISILKGFESFSNLFKEYPLNDTELFDIATFAVSKNKFALIQYLFEVQGYKQLPHLGEHGSHKTLLHEACYYGSREIIEFLLSKGAEINAVYNGTDRPIHLLIKNEKNDVNLLEILKKYGAGLNDVDPVFMISILHRAKIYQNEKAIKKLIELGANKEVQCGGLTYLQFGDFVKRTKNSNPKTKACVEALRSPYIGSSNVSFEHSAFCEWWSLLFSPIESNSFKIFQNNHKMFFQKIFNHPSARLVIDLFLCAASSYFMSSNLTFGQVKDFCKSYAPTKKIPNSLLAIMLPNLIDFFSSCRELSILNEVTVLMLEILAQSDCKNEVKAKFYVDASKAFLNTGNTEQGKKAVNHGLSLVNKDSDPQTYAYLLYNLGLLETMSGQLADLNIQRAHELLPNDMEISASYYVDLIKQKKYQAAVSLCQKFLPNNHWEILLRTAEYLLGQRKVEEFLWVLESDIDEHNFMQDESVIAQIVSDSRCFFCLQFHRIDLALEIVKKRFNTIVSGTNQPRDATSLLAKLLYVYIISEKYEEGMKFFHEIEQNNPFIVGVGSEVKEMLIVLYLANHQFEKAELLVKEIQSQISPTAQKNINEMLAVSVPTDPQTAVEYLDKLIAVFPDQTVFHYYYHLFSNLIQHENTVMSPLEYFDPELLENTALQNDLLIKKDMQTVVEAGTDMLHESQTIGSIENTENLHFTSEPIASWEYDPVQVHQYFQQQKEKKLTVFAQEYQGAFKFDVGASWVIGDKTFKGNTPGVISLNSEFCPNAFVALDPALKLDESVLFSFERALSKGLCIRQKDQEGIKIVKNSVAYIKVMHEDLRIYTTKVHVNAQGQRLYLLNSLGNHVKLDKLLRKPKPFEIIMTTAPTTPVASEYISSKASFNVVFSSPEKPNTSNLDCDSKINKGPNC